VTKAKSEAILAIAAHEADIVRPVEKTGHNDHPRIAEYLRMAGVAPGLPWCAAFVYWCCRKAGVPAAELPARGMAAAVRNWWSWAGNLRGLARNARRGDLILWLNASGTGHIGFIAGRAGPLLRTIEGNASDDPASRNGTKIVRRLRLATKNLRAIRWS
jgi:hypothetical protein